MAEHEEAAPVMLETKSQTWKLSHKPQALCLTLHEWADLPPAAMLWGSPNQSAEGELSRQALSEFLTQKKHEQ